jgi:hypothetical protein
MNDDPDHGFAPHFPPHWIQERWKMLTVAVAGSALAVGFFGTRFFGLPASVAHEGRNIVVVPNARRLLAWHEPALTAATEGEAGR